MNPRPTGSHAGCYRDLATALSALKLLCEKLRHEISGGDPLRGEVFEALIHAEDVLENL